MIGSDRPHAPVSAAIERLRAFETRWLARIAVLARGPAWLARVTLCGVVVVMALSPPDPEALAGRRGPQWPSLEEQIEHPFAAREFTADMHQAKTALRLTIPLTARAAGLGRGGLVALDVLAGVLMFPLLAVLAARATGDRLAGALLVLGAAGTYAGVLAFNDYNGPTFDAVALTLLLLAMLAERPVVIAPLVLLAAFTDERAALGAALVPLGTDACALAPRLRGVAAGLAAWLALRALLSHAYGLDTPVGDAAEVGPAVFLRQLRSWPLATWATFEALWLALIAGLACLTLRRKVLGLAVLGWVGTILLVAGSVQDSTRSALYVLPALPLALGALAQAWPRKSLNPFLFRIALVSWVVPNVFLVKGLVHWLDPVWVRLAAAMINHDIGRI